MPDDNIPIEHACEAGFVEALSATFKHTRDGVRLQSQHKSEVFNNPHRDEINQLSPCQKQGDGQNGGSLRVLAGSVVGLFSGAVAGVGMLATTDFVGYTSPPKPLDGPVSDVPPDAGIM